MRATIARIRGAVQRRLPAGLRRALLAVSLVLVVGGFVLLILPDLVSGIVGAIVLLLATALAVVTVPGLPTSGSGKRPRHQPLTGQARLLADYAELTKKRGSRALLATLQRTRSRPAREILAHVASGGRRDLAGILTTFEEFRDPALRPLAAESLTVVDARWLAALGRLLVLQQRSPQDALDAATAFDVLVARGDPQPGATEFRQFYVEALIGAGRSAEARALVATWDGVSNSELRVMADAVNPFVDGRTVDDLEEWLNLVNREWTAAGLPGVRLEGTAGVPFDRLRAGEVTAVDDGPLVTVVVSSYRPDADLLTSVRSILDSSWRRLEVLVVDDASGPDFETRYAEVESLDARVVILRLSENGGTYRARNAALDAARGELVTFQDADDWMHPHRIEVQVRHLEAHPELVANTSSSVRVTDDLEFSHLRTPEAKVCEPSLLVRREAAIARVGYFDLVRKGADSEYRHRLTAAFGEPIPTIDGPPLTWQRARDGSLSHADIGRDWVSPARRAYRASYRRWHAEIAAGRVEPRRSRDETAHRAFFAPRELGDSPERAPHYDVVFVSNWLAVGSEGGIPAIQ